ncbi:MAG: LegC family aminotransferase [Candidatus Wallbacteria bacterium]|nr:LegC family aminotransferase [Candidatus Wallbacteria bacterium]
MSEKQNFIPLSVPSFQGNELKYVTECIKTEWVSTAGAYVEKFEKEIADYTGSKYAIACANGTSALHVSLLVAGVMSGMEVIVPTLTFIAPVNTVNYVGARPIFMDCDDFLNINVDKTIDFCEKECRFDGKNLINKSSSAVVKAIIPVHIFGHPVDIEPLMELAARFNLTVIEDATESLGSYYKTGKYKGRKAGTIGELGCLSFNGNKIITTGGGGMILTSDEKLAQKAKYLTTQAKDDDVYYVHNEVGYNYRMTNIQAALGVAQLEQLPKYVEIKRKNYLVYKEKISEIPGLDLIDEPAYSFSNYWMYSLLIGEEYRLSRDELLKKLSKAGIQSRPVWKLNHEQKPYVYALAHKIEKAEKLYQRILSIPCSVSLSSQDVSRVCKTIHDNK